MINNKLWDPGMKQRPFYFSILLKNLLTKRLPKA